MSDFGSPDVTIVGTGMSNVGSVLNMFRRLGAEPCVSADPDEVRDAKRVLLPGVGAFDPGMASLVQSGMSEALRDRATAGMPILGICLGMQMLFDGSEEGVASGLGLIPGTCRRLSTNSPYGPVRIPHMGWSAMERQIEHPLLVGLAEDARYYFVHSYAVVPASAADVLGMSTHGNPFVSVAARGKVMGVQFHPEKSHRYGKALLTNFLEIS